MNKDKYLDVDWCLKHAIYQLERVEAVIPSISPIINEVVKVRASRIKDRNQLDFLTQDLPVVSRASRN